MAYGGVHEEVAEDKRVAEQLIHQIYQSKEAEDHCRRTPNVPYVVEYHGHKIIIDCEMRAEWLALQRSKGG